MKNNKFNKFNKFGRDNLPQKETRCVCGARSKLISRKNYSHGKKSKPVISQYYQCEKCGETRFLIEKQKGGRK